METEQNLNNNPDTVNKRKTIFLTGLSGLTKKKKLLEFLKLKFQGVISINLPNKRNSGYAFIQIESEDAVKRILEVKTFTFEDRELQLTPFIARNNLEKFREELNSRRVFVSKIPKNWTDDKFREFFALFGDLENAYIIRRRKNKKSRGFGFAVYKEKGTALQVASQEFVSFKDRIMMVKMHEPKERPSSINEENSKTQKIENSKMKREEELSFHNLIPTRKGYFLEMRKKREKVRYRLNYDCRSGVVRSWGRERLLLFKIRNQNYEMERNMS